MNVKLMLNQDKVRIPDQGDPKVIGNNIAFTESVADYIVGHTPYAFGVSAVNEENILAVVIPVVGKTENINLNKYATLKDCVIDLMK